VRAYAYHTYRTTFQAIAVRTPTFDGSRKPATHAGALIGLATTPEPATPR
jgi:hypothetical protein